jgi:DNA polymerase V
MSCTLIGLAVEELPMHRLPLVQARVPGGFPSPAEDYLEGTLKLDELLVKHPAATFLMRVEGDSMIGAGIHDGDLIVVDRAIEPATGKIVVAVLDGAFFVKRIVVRGEQCFLCSENPKFKDVEVGEWASLDVWGVVTNVIHALK